MAYFTQLAVDGNASANDAGAERFADGLVPETDAEERDRFVGADQFEDAARARRRAGTGRNDDRLRLLIEERVDVEAIVAHDLQFERGDPLDLLDQVVGERVVVIDNGDHGKLLNVARGRDGVRRYTIEARSETGGYSQSDEPTGRTVDSFTSQVGAFMARENSISARPHSLNGSTSAGSSPCIVSRSFDDSSGTVSTCDSGSSSLPLPAMRCIS